MKNEQPEIQELSQRVAACVSFTGNYVGKPEIFAKLFNQLCGWAEPKGLLAPETQYLSSYAKE